VLRRVATALIVEHGGVAITSSDASDSRPIIVVYLCEEPMSSGKVAIRNNVSFKSFKGFEKRTLCRHSSSGVSLWPRWRVLGRARSLITEGATRLGGLGLTTKPGNSSPGLAVGSQGNRCRWGIGVGSIFQAAEVWTATDCPSLTTPFLPATPFLALESWDGPRNSTPSVRLLRNRELPVDRSCVVDLSFLILEGQEERPRPIAADPSRNPACPASEG
jgi:hypothetical protein